MGGDATPGAGRSVDGTEGQDEGPLDRIDYPGEESRYARPQLLYNTQSTYTLSHVAGFCSMLLFPPSLAARYLQPFSHRATIAVLT